MKRPELCVGAVVVEDGRLLLIERATEPGAGLWSLPGGRVEFGESMTEAVVREVEEETGLAVTPREMIGWVERSSTEFHFVIADFEAALVGSGRLRAGDDASDARWIPLAEITTVPLVEGLVEFLVEHDVLDQG